MWQRCLGGNGEDRAKAVVEEKFDDNNVLLPDDQRSYIFIASTSSWTRDVVGYHSGLPFTIDSNTLPVLQTVQQVMIKGSPPTVSCTWW